MTCLTCGKKYTRSDHFENHLKSHDNVDTQLEDDYEMDNGDTLIDNDYDMELQNHGHGVNKLNRGSDS